MYCDLLGKSVEFPSALTLKSLINEGGYVVFLVLSEYSFIRDFRVSEWLWYYDFLPNDWNEFKLDSKTHGLGLNLSG